MRPYFSFKFIFFALSIFCFLGCSKSGSNPKTNSPPPTIPSLSVTSGPYYTFLSIIGTNFSTTFADNHVLFNGKPALTIGAGYSNATKIDAVVPLAAGTGPVTGPVFTYQPAEVLTPFAGNGIDTTATDGLGTAAGFYQPYGMTIDASGNIYIADQADNHIRKITPGGLVSSIAGSKKGYADGTGTAALFDGPEGVAIDATGNLYVTDTYNNCIRKITPAGVVTTRAGNPTKGYADGTGTAASFNYPTDLVIDASGNLYVTDLYNYRIRKVTPAGVVTTFAGNSNYFSADGVGTSANLDEPINIAIDNSGNLYVAQTDNLIRKITPNATVTTVAGTASPLTSSFEMPRGMFVDKTGNLYVGSDYQLLKVTPAGQVSVIAGIANQEGPRYGILTTATLGFMEGIVIDSNGNVYLSEGNGIDEITFE
jgi:streptogramin lyase